MTRYRMEVAGMTCADCGVHVARALEEAGAREVEVDWRRGTAVFAAGGGASVDALAGAVRDVGYRPGGVIALEAEGGWTDDSLTRPEPA